jgi:glycerol-3-phosphate dehydrogenase
VLHEGPLTADDLLDRRFRVGLVAADRSAALPAAEAAIVYGNPVTDIG